MSVATPAGRRPSKLRIALLTVGLVAAALVLPPLVSLKRFHAQIAQSISAGIGRPVAMSSITMHLLPRPGFELTDFVIEEDPAFGAEPVLRSPNVTAYLRLLSLWRGRLEIARIALDEPSVNLTRNQQGRWSFDSLLSQAAQTTKAPTAERHPGGTARFPYIGASNARINFKFGNEKMPFSLLNADLAIWLANPGEWRIQFAAQPVRTDLSLDLANTGILRLDGSLRRASTLTQMPLQLGMQWVNAPLGELSRLLTGSDAGWRGRLDTRAAISGTLDLAQVTLHGSLREIHRAEFEPRSPLDAEVTCEFQFARVGRVFNGITCLTPTGAGHVLLTGSLHGIGTHAAPRLSVLLDHVPVALAFGGMQLARANLAMPAPLGGTIDGNFTYGGDFLNDQLQGQATVSGLNIASPALPDPLQLPLLHFVVNTPLVQPARRKRDLRTLVGRAVPDGATLLLLPATLPLAQPESGPPSSSVTISGTFTRSGFSLNAIGQSRADQVFALGNQFGGLSTRSLHFAPRGVADFDVSIHGPWLASSNDANSSLSVDGSMRLRNAQLNADGLRQPVQIISAQAALAEREITWTASSLAYGPIRGDGTLSYPTYCDAQPHCAHHFSLQFATLDTATAQNTILGQDRQGALVGQLLSQLRRLHRENPVWPELSGELRIGTLTIKNLAVHDVNASVAIENNEAQIKSLTGKTLNGALHLNGSLVVDGSTPHYTVKANLEHAAVSELADLFGENWGPGSVDLTTQLNFSGYEVEKLLSSTTGSFHWQWSNGGLPVAVETPDPASSPGETDAPGSSSTLFRHFDLWSAKGSIADRGLTLDDSSMKSVANALPIHGSITFNRELDLTAETPSLQEQITGTIEHPTFRNSTAAKVRP